MRPRLAFLPALFCAGLFAAVYAQPGAEDAPPEGVEVQTRGPVHEAYAEPAETRDNPGVVVNKQPPAPVEEVPPEEKFEGDNVSWIPGYWAWDDEAGDFLWVSGIWRDEPPGRDWVPGEWQKAQAGYQWVPGYWAVEGQDEIEYLPAPPESLERGPSAPAPSENSAYIPGTWLYQANRYAWQPGYWTTHQPGWVWMSACYKWTPGGHVFVKGYWDRPLAERGLLFAPVRFAPKVIARRDFSYRPSFVVRPDFLLGSLFVRSATRNYHFGDYFEARHREKYVPWVDYRVNKVNYDTNYTYYRSNFARQPGWDRGLRALYAGRYKGEVPRPPRTLVQQAQVVNNINVNKTVNTVVNKNVNITNVQNVTAVQSIRKAKNLEVTSLSSLANLRPDATKELGRREMRIQQVRKEQVEVERKQVERYRAVSKERVRTETTLATKGRTVKEAAPARVRYELPKTVPPRLARKAVNVPPPPDRPKGPPEKPEKKDRRRDKD